MSTPWPAWASEPVEIAEPDAAWPRRAARLRQQVEGCVGALLDGDVEHVGSTAVPGLAAKPVVDLMAPVVSTAAAHLADEPLAAAGWQLVPPTLDGRPWRRFYVLAEGGRRRAHLHLVCRSHRRWREALRFRDLLRARPSLADEYAALKQRLAASHHDDREAYSAAKGEFIERALGADRP